MLYNITTYEQFNIADPYGEEEWDNFEDIIIDSNKVDGIYYLIYETYIFLDGFPVKQNIFYKLELKKQKNDKISWYKYYTGRKQLEFWSNYKQLIHALKTYYPKGNINESNQYYLFKEEDWGSNRMKYIFRNVFNLDFDEFKDVIKYYTDKYGSIEGESIRGCKEMCIRRHVDFNLENYIGILKKISDEQKEYMNRSNKLKKK